MTGYTLSETELEGIEAGLADIESGNTHTHEHVMMAIEKIITDFGHC